MLVTIRGKYHESKGGTSLRVDTIPVTGFGKSEAEAMSAAERMLYAWCRSLSRCGLLSVALKRAGAAVVGEGDEAIEVRIEPA